MLPLVVSDWSNQQWGTSDHANYTCGGSVIIDPSIRWKSSEEYQHSFKYFNNGQAGILTSLISLDAIQEYREYRKETGLLP